MVSKEQKKIERVINFMKKGLNSLADDLEETVKGINDFIKSLAKAQKDLKEVSVGEEVLTVSTSSKKIVATTDGQAKTAAASTLFSLLSTSGGAGAPVPAAAPATTLPAAPTPPGAGPPSAPKPPSAGPPTKAGPPTAPPSSVGPPRKPGLPPAPKLPPTGGAPPVAPSASPPKAPSGPTSASPPSAPAFAKRPPAPAAAPTTAAKVGGGLGSLRDEMLDELNRLKKIMRGE